MTTEIFNTLFNSLECDAWDINGQIGFESELKTKEGVYVMNIYGEFDPEGKTSFDLQIEEIGFSKQPGHFEEYQPSEEQLKRLQRKINSKVNELEEEADQEEIDRAYSKDVTSTLNNLFNSFNTGV